MRDIIISPEENIYAKSLVTYIQYKVYKIWIINGKVKKYFIKNQGVYEWWDSSRFIVNQTCSNCCGCLCERCHKGGIYGSKSN